MVRADHVREGKSVVGEAEGGHRRRRRPPLRPHRRVGACRGDQGQRDHRDPAHRISTLIVAPGCVKDSGGRAILRVGSRMTRALSLLYRLGYEGILSRLPEPTAVALGQQALRVLPWDRLPVFRREDPRLAVTLGGVRLPNPLILAAMYYDTRILGRAMGLGFGAVTAKSITTGPRPRSEERRVGKECRSRWSPYH